MFDCPSFSSTCCTKKTKPQPFVYSQNNQQQHNLLRIDCQFFPKFLRSHLHKECLISLSGNSVGNWKVQPLDTLPNAATTVSRSYVKLQQYIYLCSLSETHGKCGWVALRKPMEARALTKTHGGSVESIKA
jgi:hypothetical protein